jgi:hypothetical protein
MKKLLTVLLLCLSATFSIAQDLQFSSGREKHDGKPQLLTNLSTKISVRSNFFEEVMNYKINQQVSINVTEGFLFNGNVTAKTNDAPGLETLIIQSTEKEGLVLSLSKLVLQDQTIVYRGVLISKHHSDLLMLEKDIVTGNYNWNKKNVSLMISD